MTLLACMCVVLGVLVLLAIPTSGGEPAAILPRPKRLTANTGAPFILDPISTRVVVSDKSLESVADYLADVLAPAMGALLARGTQDAPRSIHLQLDRTLALNDEGYRLSATADAVRITARTPHGVFYGVQTLRQLLPARNFAAQWQDGLRWTIAAVEIEDQPRFAWRGLMLDVSRHFFGVAEVKRFIDLLAMHKFNAFHWHLVDDQGWRIEIKSYPKLTSVGAWRSGIGFGLDPKATTAYGADGRYGGYFSQDDVRAIVAYAAARHIQVVPEIEMPGHSTAALAAYPELSCSGGPFTTELNAGVHPGVYCASNPAVDAFIEAVLREVLDLFPCKFIHVGGDEVPKEPWKNCPRCQAYIKARGLKDEHELQSDFIRRADRFLTARGRRLVGWDEILEGGLAEGATVMSWRGTQGGVAAARAGHDVVMSPNSHWYLDHYQAPKETQPKAIGGFSPLEKVYAFDPIVDALAPNEATHVLGGQGNLWVEYVPNFRHVEYMTYPRACAIAEALWSPQQDRDFNDFMARLRPHQLRLDALDVNYCTEALPR